jgi:transcriptional regulator with XRE-family HTH domain
MPAMSKKRGGTSLYARRFHNLLVQLERKGMSQAEISRRTGLSQGYLSKWRWPENNSLQDIGSVTIERVIKGLRIRGGFFTDEYPESEERPFELYSFENALKERQVDELVKQNEKLTSLLESVLKRLEVLEGGNLKTPGKTK